MNNFLTHFYKLLAYASGQTFDPLWADKAKFILQGVVAVGVFIAAFFFVYYKYCWSSKELRKLFLICTGATLTLVATKFIIYHFSKGYRIDRFLFYTLPSPRVKSFAALFLACALFAGFLYFRKKIERLSRAKFMATIALFFSAFSLSVAGIRDGVAGIIDPLTRTFWEYTGALPFVFRLGLRGFIREYTRLIPVLPVHPGTHPPGYVVFLYLVEKIFHVQFVGLAVAIVIVSALGILLLHILWEKIFGQSIARRMTQVMVFVPSLVFFSATSLEAFNFFIIWAALVLCYLGWKKNFLCSIAAGLCAGYALFSNYLFILQGPLLLTMLVMSIKSAPKEEKKIVTYRALSSLAGFIGFFFVLWYTFGYFTITNFFSGYDFYKTFAVSNFASVSLYFSFAVINLIPFVWYLGAPTIVYFAKDAKKQFAKSTWWFKTGVLMWLVFCFIGIFQGEIERIWLFLMPLFLMYPSKLYDQADNKEFNAALSLMFFQIIVFQIVFYTYW